MLFIAKNKLKRLMWRKNVMTNQHIHRNHLIIAAT